jgi:2-isopropylmalate synthase
MYAIIELTVNGDRRSTGIPAHYTLLETLRYALGLTGSKQGCDKGDCGACTVLLDGEPVLACITPAWEAEGREVCTVEGIAGSGTLHPLQEAFEITGGAQCGFCTPGVLMSAYALLQRTRSPTREQILEALSGNLCRCTGYTKIVEGVEIAGRLMSGGSGADVPVPVHEYESGADVPVHEDGSGSVNVNENVDGVG